MKTLFLTLILTVIFGGFMETQAQTQVKLRAGKQETATADKLTIKFVSVLEDSRCPIGTDCIWAGNARVQIEVSNRCGESKTFELNTHLQPQAADFSGWYILLEGLSPHPKANVEINKNSYTATFSIKRLTR